MINYNDPNRTVLAVEQTVSDDRKGRAKLIKFLTIWSMIFLAAVVYLVCMLFVDLLLGLVLAFIIIFAGVIIFKKISRALSTEYQYSFIDGHFSVAKIYNRSESEFIAELDCDDIIMMGRISANHIKLIDATAKSAIYAIPNPESGGRWFIVYKWHSTKRRISFVPNQELIDAFRTYLPKNNFSEE